MAKRPTWIVAGALVPGIVVGHLIVEPEFCEPHCEWLHQPHIEVGSTGTMINSMVWSAAFSARST